MLCDQLGRVVFSKAVLHISESDNLFTENTTNFSAQNYCFLDLKNYFLNPILNYQGPTQHREQLGQIIDAKNKINMENTLENKCLYVKKCLGDQL